MRAETASADLYAAVLARTRELLDAPPVRWRAVLAMVWDDEALGASLPRRVPAEPRTPPVFDQVDEVAIADGIDAAAELLADRLRARYTILTERDSTFSRLLTHTVTG